MAPLTTNPIPLTRATCNLTARNRDRRGRFRTWLKRDTICSHSLKDGCGVAFFALNENALAGPSICIPAGSKEPRIYDSGGDVAGHRNRGQHSVVQHRVWGSAAPVAL